MTEYKTKTFDGYMATVNPSGLCWACLNGAHLGTITTPDGYVFGWAWRADGRSIDPHDRAFDLIDFPAPAATYHHWLGSDG